MSKYQTILAVCETHSISKAASKLNYTQSAVSQTIKNFEKELGVPLFKRSKQGMELLPGTEEIMDSLRIICQEENKISQIAAGLTSLEKAISASGRFRAFLITGSLISCGTFPKVIPISGSN